MARYNCAVIQRQYDPSGNQLEGVYVFFSNKYFPDEIDSGHHATRSFFSVKNFNNPYDEAVAVAMKWVKPKRGEIYERVQSDRGGKPTLNKIK